MDAQIKRGFLDACVLASMANGESYGYQIIKELPDSIGISESTLYPLLKRLESKKFIACRKVEHNGRLRKYYSLTAKGREELEDFLKDKQAINDVFAFIERAVNGAAASPCNSENHADGAEE